MRYVKNHSSQTPLSRTRGVAGYDTMKSARLAVASKASMKSNTTKAHIFDWVNPIGHHQGLLAFEAPRDSHEMLRPADALQ